MFVFLNSIIFVYTSRTLGKHLCSVSDVYFSYFSHATSCGKYQHASVVPIDGHPSGGIKVWISKRNPHQKLTGVDEGTKSIVFQT